MGLACRVFLECQQTFDKLEFSLELRNQHALRSSERRAAGGCTRCAMHSMLPWNSMYEGVHTDQELPVQDAPAHGERAVRARLHVPDALRAPHMACLSLLHDSQACHGPFTP